MGKSRILRIALVTVAAVTLSGCVLLPGPDGPDGSPSPSPTSSAEGNEAPSAADPELVVLNDDEVVPLPVFTRSTPGGTWPVGTGIPPGFPAGVPVYPDRWIDDSYLEFDSEGRPGYSAMFWGGYEDVDQIVQRLDELGFDIEDQQDETKRVIVADSDRYRVVINATETAKNAGDADFLDPSYTTTVVTKD